MYSASNAMHFYNFSIYIRGVIFSETVPMIIAIKMCDIKDTIISSHPSSNRFMPDHSLCSSQSLSLQMLARSQSEVN